MAQVVGANARKLRLDAGMTLDQFARAARLCGLPWSSGRVGDFESGNVSPTFPTLYGVALALGAKPDELFAVHPETETGDGPVQMNDDLTVDLSALRAFTLGKPATGETEAARKLKTVMDKGARLAVTQLPEWKRLPKWARDNVDPGDWIRVDGEFRESDGRICKSLGMSREIGVAAMALLWKSTFVAERDRLAGPDANAQRRGQISRQLKAELEKAVR